MAIPYSDNEYTLYYKYAREYNVPVDWIIRTDDGSYTTFYYLLEEEMNSGRHNGSLKSVISYVFVEASRNNIIERDVMTYDVIRIVFDKVDATNDYKLSMCYDNITAFESSMGLSGSFQSIDTVSIFYKTVAAKWEISAIETKRMLKIIDDYESWVFKVNDRRPGIDQGEFIRVDKEEIIFTTMMFSYNGIRPSSGMFIFNRILVDDKITYIHYIDDDGYDYFKVYSGNSIGRPINYKRTMIDKKRANARNIIQLTVRLGPGTVHSASFENFYHAVFDLEEGTIVCKVPVALRTINTNYETKIVDVIRTNVTDRISSDPRIVLKDLGPIGHIAEVNLFLDISFNEQTFLIQVTNDDLFRYLYYAEESMLPFGRKKRYEIYYTPFMSRKFAPAPDVVVQRPPKLSIIFRDTMGQSFNVLPFPGKSKYMRVRITGATSREHVRETIGVLVNSLKIHSIRGYSGDTFRQIFSNWDTKLQETELTNVNRAAEDNDRFRTSSSKEGMERIRKLNAHPIYSKVFGLGYHSDCPADNSPMVFATKSEAKEWVKGSPLVRKDAIPFPAPPEEPLFWFTGIGNSPYPNIVENTDASTMDEYQYVPKCTSYDPSTRPLTSLYNRVYGKSGVVPEKSGVVHVSDKLMGVDNYGQIPLSMARLFDKEPTTMRKQGAADPFKYGTSTRNSNSFIHCVMLAVGDRERNTIPGVEQFRKECSTPQYRALVKQEFHDKSDSEIDTMFKDNSIFFDPSLFYRVLEEFYGINIFVFTNEGVTVSEDARLDIPRNRVFHSRPVRMERPTVIIFKNMGPARTQKKYDYPHCELVTISDGNIGNFSTQFQEDITERCYFALGESCDAITYRKVGSNVLGYNRLYNIDIEKFFKGGITGQRIDSRGHARSFDIVFGDGHNASIYFPPTQPVAVSISESVKRITVDTALVLMKQLKLYSCSKTATGLIDGLWFSYVDVDEFFFIPVHETDRQLGVPQGSDSPVVNAGTVSITRRNILLKKTINIISHLVIWAFDLFRKSLIPERTQSVLPNYVSVEKSGTDQRLVILKDDVLEFIDRDGDDRQFISIFFRPRSEGFVGDSSGYYKDIFNMKELLPVCENLVECMSYVHSLCPSFVDSNGKFITYDDSFKRGLEYLVSRHFKETFCAEAIVQEHIKGYYLNHTEFEQTPYVEVFIGKQELREWLDIVMSVNYRPVRQRIEIKYHSERQPYLFEDETGSVMIIQNAEFDVTDHLRALYSAIVICMNWKQDKTNTGYYTRGKKTITELTGYALFVITPDGRPLLIKKYKKGAKVPVKPEEDSEDDDEDYARILVYAGYNDWYGEVSANIRYAAMLELD